MGERERLHYFHSPEQLTRLPFAEIGRLGGGEHEFDFGHVKFQMIFQHLNESGVGLETRSLHGYVKEACYHVKVVL